MGYFSQNYADFSQNYANYVAFYLRVDHILLPISSFLIKIWFLSVYNTNVVRPWLKVASFISQKTFSFRRLLLTVLPVRTLVHTILNLVNTPTNLRSSFETHSTHTCVCVHTVLNLVGSYGAKFSTPVGNNNGFPLFRFLFIFFI